MNPLPASPAAGVLRVAVDRPLRSLLDYLPLPDRDVESCPIGSRVRVPIGRGTAVGVVVEHANSSALAPERLKPVAELLDSAPLLAPELLALLRWTAHYYLHPIGEVVMSALPAALRAGASALPQRQLADLTDAGREAWQAGEPRRAPKQRALLAVLGNAAGGICIDDLDLMDPQWRAAARALRARGWVELVSEAVDEPSKAVHPASIALAAGPPLTDAQAAAVAALSDSAGTFHTLVLQGATGSGKTEVYLRAVAETLARGGSALVLVPEIGLTPQLVGRFRARFAATLAVMHSGLTDGERLAAWRDAHSGAARIVIGTRSAVFAPLPQLGLIIVDEEHDSSYKQQEGGCRYSARDLAVYRAQQAQVPVLLGSATPALETLHNIQRGRYRRLLLPRRADQAAAPTLALIDLRTQSLTAGISGAVLQAMQRHLQSDGQVLVYINRRGYAPTLLCTACGWIAPCHACDARLTVHRAIGRLRCHYCGADEPLPTRCNRCGFAVKPVGQGTERIEERLAELFPAEKLARLDRDTARRPGDIEQVMRAVLDGKARILVGTQMVTKGHHFPEVTLVVVLNADQGLFSTDYRAAERLAQTIVQVAGRAGRATRAGEVLIQTEYPDHPLLQSLLRGGYEAFADSALAERAAAHWPPFARVALLRASAPRAEQASGFLAAARQHAEQQLPVTQVRLLGPVNAAMARRAGRHHAQLLIESADRGALHRFLEAWIGAIEQLPAARRVRWALDIDPIDNQ